MDRPAWCGSCQAGVLVMNGNEIQRCDACNVFPSDVDAAALVDALLALLGETFRERGGKVGTAVAFMEQAVTSAMEDDARKARHAFLVKSFRKGGES